FLIHLRQHQGDLFATFEEFFSSWILEIFKGENVLFYKNLFTSLDPRAIHRFITFNEANQRKELRKTSYAAHEKMQEITKAMLKEIDQTKLAVVDDQQLELLFRLLIHITFSTIADGYRHHCKNGEYDIQKINEEFHLKLNWLQKGMETNERGNH
ncbi:MAG: TetR/AcrR family transcriptional regulator, partial [Tetragenococcus halophilus]|nr:TetR/AcrR family transcriptional regulator [Tetragenococcus halophilus]